MINHLIDLIPANKREICVMDVVSDSAGNVGIVGAIDYINGVASMEWPMSCPADNTVQLSALKLEVEYQLLLDTLQSAYNSKHETAAALGQSDGDQCQTRARTDCMGTRELDSQSAEEIAEAHAARAELAALREAVLEVDRAICAGDLAFTRKRRSDSDPYHPANTALTKALSAMSGDKDD